MMRKILPLAICCFCFSVSLFAQQGGAQRLRLAQSIYEQGRLHELPDLLRKGFQGNEFTKDQQVQAYKLLTLAHIYLEEPEAADTTMQKLLQTDHFFEPNKDVDPAEFIALYHTFRTKPVFSLGLKFGVNSTAPMLSEVYYVSDAAKGNGKYSIGIGFQVGLSFEKEFFQKSKSKFLRRVTFVPEAFFTNRTFGYSNGTMFASDVDQSTSVADLQATIKQSWLDINPILQYRMSREDNKTLTTYVGLGPGVSYLLSGTNTLVLTRDKGKGVVSGPDVDMSKSYQTLVPTAIGLAGLKYKFGAIYLLAEVRIQYALLNPIKASSRSVPQSAFDYNYVPSNYYPANLTANIGFIYPYFNPIKLKRK